MAALLCGQVQSSYGLKGVCVSFSFIELILGNSFSLFLRYFLFFFLYACLFITRDKVRRNFVAVVLQCFQAFKKCTNLTICLVSEKCTTMVQCFNWLPVHSQEYTLTQTPNQDASLNHSPPARVRGARRRRASPDRTRARGDLSQFFLVFSKLQKNYNQNFQYTTPIHN